MKFLLKQFKGHFHFAKLTDNNFFKDQMAITRCKSNLQDIQTRIRKFNNEYRNPDKLKSIGWQPVPVVNVNQSTNWLQVTSELISTGYFEICGERLGENSHCYIKSSVI